MDYDKVIALLKEVEQEVGDRKTTDPLFEVARLAEIARAEMEWCKEHGYD